MSKYKYFTEEEFLRCKPSSSLYGMSERLLRMLDEARELAGIPFRITSAIRSYDYEIFHGRSGKSSHCIGKAVDIACSDSHSRLLIVWALLAVGFSRIGIYSRHIHVDNDDLKNDCLFLGSYEKE